MRAYLIVGAVLVAGLWVVAVCFVGPRCPPFAFDAAVATQDLEVLGAAFDSFARDQGGRCARRLEELLPDEAGGEGYLHGRTSVPNDPWKRPYRLEVAADGSWLRVGSLGRDGEPGGSGDAADSWVTSFGTR